MNIFTKKTLYLAIGILLHVTAAYSQSKGVNFTFKDGSTAKYLLNTLQNFTFPTDNQILIKKKDGTVVTYTLSTVANYRYFDSISLSVNDIEIANTAEVRIYPNPFRGYVHISYVLPTAEQVGIEIFDMAGRSIKKWAPERKTAGTHEVIWQASETNSKSIAPGTYICRIHTSKGSVSKMMIME
jgi:hypothetical protein